MSCFDGLRGAAVLREAHRGVARRGGLTFNAESSTDLGGLGRILSGVHGMTQLHEVSLAAGGHTDAALSDVLMALSPENDTATSERVPPAQRRRSPPVVPGAGASEHPGAHGAHNPLTQVAASTGDLGSTGRIGSTIETGDNTWSKQPVKQAAARPTPPPAASLAPRTTATKRSAAPATSTIDQAARSAPPDEPKGSSAERPDTLAAIGGATPVRIPAPYTSSTPFSPNFSNHSSNHPDDSALALAPVTPSTGQHGTHDSQRRNPLPRLPASRQDAAPEPARADTTTVAGPLGRSNPSPPSHGNVETTHEAASQLAGLARLWDPSHELADATGRPDASPVGATPPGNPAVRDSSASPAQTLAAGVKFDVDPRPAYFAALLESTLLAEALADGVEVRP